MKIGLVTRDSTGGMSSTEYGEIMAKYYLKLDTMIAFLNIQQNSTLDTLVYDDDSILNSSWKYSVKLPNFEKSVIAETKHILMI